MIKSIIAVFVGVVVFGVFVFVLENVGHQIVPVPEEIRAAGSDMTKAMEAARKAAADGKITTSHYALVLIAWAIAAFFGGGLAAALAPNKPYLHAGIVGGFGLLLAIMNMAMLPHPPWAWVIGVLEFFPMALLGAMCMGKKSAVAAA